MDPKIKSTFDELFKIEENKHCFDCGDNSEEWASVNNGIFLCDKCAMIHKKFGVNVSSIRRITTDPWSDIHLLMMINGGNAKLREFFEKYYIPKDGPKDFKYRTKAGYFYRKNLRALAEGTFFPDPIDPEEALELDNDADPNAVPDYEYGYRATIPKEESGLNKMYAFLEKKFDKTVTATKDTATGFAGMVKDPSFVDGVKMGVKDMGTTIVSETKNVATIINEKINDPNLKQGIADVGSKISTGVKSGFMSAFGFFKNITGIENPQQENKVNIEEEKFETISFSEESQSEQQNEEIKSEENQQIQSEDKKNNEASNTNSNEIPTL